MHHSQDAAAGVVKAKAIVAETASKLKQLRAVTHKLQQLAADFDKRSASAPLA